MADTPDASRTSTHTAFIPLAVFTHVSAYSQECRISHVCAYRTGESATRQQKTFGIDEVLDFFETVAVFTKRRVPDGKLTYSTFYWPMSMYWVLVRDYILETQKAEGEECWKEYNALMTKLIAREGREPTLAEAQGFLDDELVRCSLAHALRSSYTAPYGSD
jgi:hypothetical protein